MRKIRKILFTALITFVLFSPVAVSAATWHSAGITLPRFGKRWRTVSRKSTSNTQGLKATKNAHQVIGNIDNLGNKEIGKWQTFKVHNTGAKYTTTYSKGSTIKAVFRTNGYNAFTTTANLSWRP